MKPLFMQKAAIGALALLLAASASADVVRVGMDAFQPGTGLITFSEFAVGTDNPSYAPSVYGGGDGAPVVDFGGYFLGQRLSPNPAEDCPGGQRAGCVIGTPAGPLGLDAAAPDATIRVDGGNPTSPVMSGSPSFRGAIAILFSSDQAGVGLDAGWFDALGSTTVRAFARDGTLLGGDTNVATGIEFIGLVSGDGSAQIAGLLISTVGPEPAGFGIDNVRFGGAGQVLPPPVPEPAGWALLGAGLGVLALRRRAGRSI